VRHYNSEAFTMFRSVMQLHNRKLLASVCCRRACLSTTPFSAAGPVASSSSTSSSSSSPSSLMTSPREGLPRWPQLSSATGILRSLDWLGTVVFAASGSLTAATMGCDILGCSIIGTITAGIILYKSNCVLS
jgi:hypothetical protein